MATPALPVLPPAPGLLTTTNGLPSRSPSFCATMRASTSVGPPDANGTTSVTGPLGYFAMAAAAAFSCAAACDAPKLAMRIRTDEIKARMDVSCESG